MSQQNNSRACRVVDQSRSPITLAINHGRAIPLARLARAIRREREGAITIANDSRRNQTNVGEVSIFTYIIMYVSNFTQI